MLLQLTFFPRLGFLIASYSSSNSDAMKSPFPSLRLIARCTCIVVLRMHMCCVVVLTWRGLVVLDVDRMLSVMCVPWDPVHLHTDSVRNSGRHHWHGVWGIQYLVLSLFNENLIQIQWRITTQIDSDIWYQFSKLIYNWNGDFLFVLNYSLLCMHVLLQ